MRVWTLFAYLNAGALAQAPSAPPMAPPPMAPLCTENATDPGACVVSLAVESCGVAPHLDQLCLTIDKNWYAMAIAYRCVHLYTHEHTTTCLALSSGMQPYAALMEFSNAGAFLTTTLQQQKAIATLPYGNAPPSLSGTTALIPSAGNVMLGSAPASSSALMVGKCPMAQAIASGTPLLGDALSPGMYTK